MNRKLALPTAAVLCGVLFSQQAAGLSPGFRPEIERGTESVSNLSFVEQVVSLDGVEQNAFPPPSTLVRGLVYQVLASADSADGPATGSIFSTAIRVHNDGADPLSVDVTYEATLDTSGRIAYANTQLQTNCSGLCIPVSGTLKLLPDPLQAVYNSYLQSAGLSPNTIRRLETVLATDDTEFGRSMFLAATGKIDLGLPLGTLVAFRALLAPGGSLWTGLSVNASAFDSTATVDGRLSIAVAAIPEPGTSTLMLLGLGLAGLAARRMMPSSA